MTMRLLGWAALSIALASCGRARKAEPRTDVHRQGGAAGLSGHPAGEGGEANHTGNAGSSGAVTGGAAGSAVDPRTGGSAGVEAGGRGSTAGAGGGGNAASGSGGKPSGGGSSGAGAGTAGASGKPVPVPIAPTWAEPLPADCERTGEEATEDACAVTLECAGGGMSVRCWGEPGDLARCACETDRRLIEPFELEDFSGIGTCRTVALICGSGEPLDLDGDEECSTLAASTSTTSCDLHQSCTNALASSNVPVRFTRERSIACAGTAEDKVTCACGTGPLRLELEDDPEPATACERMIARCDALPASDTNTPPTCTLELQSTFERYCHADGACTHETRDGDVTALYDEPRDVLCRGEAEAGALCICTAGTSHLTFRREEPVDGIDVCNDYLEGCTFDAFELDGPATCTAPEAEVTPEACVSSLTCAQPATRAGEAVTILGRLWINCVAADGGWSCQCHSDTRHLPLDVTADDYAAACTEARAACAAAIPPEQWAPY